MSDRQSISASAVALCAEDGSVMGICIFRFRCATTRIMNQVLGLYDGAMQASDDCFTLWTFGGLLERDSCAEEHR